MAAIQITTYCAEQGWLCWPPERLCLCGYFRDIFALGADKLVLFGTCGVLDERDIKELLLFLVMPIGWRTSFHYVETNDEDSINVVFRPFRSYLNERQDSHKRKAKFGQADGIYRGTDGKLKARKASRSHLLWI